MQAHSKNDLNQQVLLDLRIRNESNRTAKTVSGPLNQSN